MRSSIALASVLACTTSALDYCAGNKATLGHCDTLTYIDRTTSTSNAPTASQCQDTCFGLFSDAGDWGVSFSSGQSDAYRQVLLGYPCGFSMGRAPGEPTDYEFSMDNQDIADILDEVSNKFAPLHGGKVAAQGLVRCDGFNATWYVDHE